MCIDASNQEASPCLESSAATQLPSNTCFKVAKSHGLAARLTDTHLLSQPHEGVIFSRILPGLTLVWFFGFSEVLVFLWPVGLFVAFFDKEYTLPWSFLQTSVRSR